MAEIRVAADCRSPDWEYHWLPESWGYCPRKASLIRRSHGRIAWSRRRRSRSSLRLSSLSTRTSSGLDRALVAYDSQILNFQLREFSGRRVWVRRQFARRDFRKLSAGPSQSRVSPPQLEHHPGACLHEGIALVSSDAALQGEVSGGCFCLRGVAMGRQHAAVLTALGPGGSNRQQEDCRNEQCLG